MNNDLWTRWAEHYSQFGVDPNSICQDGIINPDLFKNANRKILFVLKEVNDYPGGKLELALAKGPKYPMWFAVARWAAGLLKDFPRFSDIDHGNILIESIKSIAAINLKKASGGPIARSSQINLFAHFDRELLVEQIRNIAPQIIVACGTFDQLVWLLNININPNDIDSSCHYLSSDHILIINWRHPSRVSAQSSYNELSKVSKKYLEKL
jgi:hypothetical protein